MYRMLVFTLILSLPQIAAARLYICVDEATGATTFTDKACETTGSQEEIRVNAINPGSTSRPSRVEQKTWRSEADVRKTGSDYNSERRSTYEHDASASTQ